MAVLKLAALLWCNQTTTAFGSGSHRSRSPVFILGSIRGSFWTIAGGEGAVGALASVCGSEVKGPCSVLTTKDQSILDL